MAIIYEHNGDYTKPEACPNIAAFVLAAQANRKPTGALPWGPMAGTATSLGQTQQAAQAIRSDQSLGGARKTIAFGLLTCAAVIYASTDPNAARVCWVHHAPSGAITVANVTNARVQLGNPPWPSIIVVIAHPEAHNNYYQADTNTIAGQGVPPNNIVVIPNVEPHFGVNNRAQLGC